MSRTEPHLVAAISPHGFGHAAQTAPVLNALRARAPDLRLTLRTTAPRDLLAARVRGPWNYEPVASDFGMVMASALDIRADESAVAYARLHDRWEEEVDREAAALAALDPDLVLCNVPYLPLAAAARLGIPAVALCSLNWADIYMHYCGGRPEAAAVHAQMLDAYRAARWFLQPEPGMPMTDLPNRRPIGPIAAVGADRRDELHRQFGLGPRERAVLIAPGGIALPFPVDAWPRLAGVRWIVPGAWKIARPDAIAREAIPMPFVDLLRSSDAVIGKPGYGTFVEAGCNGTPVLYVRRHDWPEEPYLVDWLERRGRALQIDRSRLDRGDVTDALDALLALPAPPPVMPTGADEAASLILGACP